MTSCFQRKEFRYFARFLTLNSLIIVNCVILVSNIINYYAFNAKPGPEVDSCDGYTGKSSSAGNCWPSKVFAPISAMDRALLDQTLREFVAAVETANLTYFIYGGTLIGSLRHHGPIPWDDDVDVMFSAEDKVKLIEVLTERHPDFGLFMPANDSFHPQWKFYPTDGHVVTITKYKTPYIDIFFYRENATHIWCESPMWNKTDAWLKQNVFPLVRRPFGALSLPAPCNGMVVIGPSVKISRCQSRGYNHIKDATELQPVIVISCKNLSSFYPFVRRSIVAEGPSSGKAIKRVKETLMFQNWTLQEITVNQSC